MSSLTRKLEARANVTISYEALNVFINIESSIDTIEKFIAFDFTWMLFNHIVVSELNNLKTKTIKVEYVLFVSKIQRVVSFLAFRERDFVMMSRFISKCFENLRCELIMILDLFSQRLRESIDWIFFKINFFWFNCDFASSTFDFVNFIFMSVKMIKNINETKQKCNWIRSKTMIRQWKSTRWNFKVNSFFIFLFKTWNFNIVWCWYRWRESLIFFSLKKSFERRINASSLSSTLLDRYVI